MTPTASGNSDDNHSAADSEHRVHPAHQRLATKATFTGPANSRYASLPISLSMIRDQLSVPLLCDALDAVGLTRQSPRLPWMPLTVQGSLLIGRAKTLLWADMAHEDPKPYELELAAIDSCEADDVLVCAAGCSMRSGIWGELLSTAALHRGCAGVIVDGAVRDVTKMQAIRFAVHGRGTSPYDSRNRQRVIDYDVVVELEGVRVAPGDIIAADADGVVIVPTAVESQVIASAWRKATAENKVREAVASGMSAAEAYQTFGVL